MDETLKTDLERPDQVRAADGQRRDGRPAEAHGGDEEAGRPPQPEAPTVAPEEEGETPTTEHAPGADL